MPTADPTTKTATLPTAADKSAAAAAATPASAPPIAPAPALPAAPARQTTLDAWLSTNAAELLGECRAPSKLKSTPATLACYAIDNHEIWVLSWANGQRWTILRDAGGIAGLEAFLEAGEGD